MCGSTTSASSSENAARATIVSGVSLAVILATASTAALVRREALAFLSFSHERYFYAADVFTIVLAFYRSRWVVVAVVVQLVSFLSYWPFLFGHAAVPLATLAVVESVALMALAVLLARG